MRRLSDIGHRLFSREVIQQELQNADRFTAARHRSEQPSASLLVDHLDDLGGKRAAVRRPDECHVLRGLLPLQAPFPPAWPRRISDCPLKSAIKKLTSRASIASASAPASTSAAATGGAASTAASNEFKFNGKCRSSPTQP